MLSIRVYFFKDMSVLASLALALVALAGSWLMLVAIPRPTEDDPFVILYYTIYFGIQRIGPWDSLFFIPAVATIGLVVQGVVAYALYDRDRFWSYTLLMSGAFMTIIIFFVNLFLLTINA